jgi:hypothetical protein
VGTILCKQLKIWVYCHSLPVGISTLLSITSFSFILAANCSRLNTLLCPCSVVPITRCYFLTLVYASVCMSYVLETHYITQNSGGSRRLHNPTREYRRGTIYVLMRPWAIASAFAISRPLISSIRCLSTGHTTPRRSVSTANVALLRILLRNPELDPSTAEAELRWIKQECQTPLLLHELCVRRGKGEPLQYILGMSPHPTKLIVKEQLISDH